MTEDDAKEWFAIRYDRDVVSKLDQYRDMLIAENGRQNLIAPSTISKIWSRHLLDSGQLVEYAPREWRYWIDIGSGAGLPGLVVAILTGRKLVLIEPRRLRAEFLLRCRDALDLQAVDVVQAKAENASPNGPIDVISARAVASLDAVFAASGHLATTATRYILPKGESAQSEVAAAQRSWHGVFHVEQSIVDPRSGIVVASGVSRR